MAFLSRSVIIFISTLPFLINFSNAETTAPKSITRKYELYHDLGNGFVPRNSFIAVTASPSESSNDDNSGEVSYDLSAALEASKDEDTEEILDNCEDETCSSKSMEEIAILDLMKSGKFYRIKARDLETGKEALTSVHPCSIRKSNLRENINLILSHKADLISIDYIPIISPILSKVSCQTFESSDETNTKSLEFTTTSITYSTSTPAMTIPLILPNINLPKGAIQMLPKDKKRTTATPGQGSGSTGKGDFFQDMMTEEQGAPKSFLMRYWYVILPMVIMTFFSEAPEDPNAAQKGQEQGQSQGQARPGVAAATAVAGASVSASSGSTRQRRGKRS